MTRQQASREVRVCADQGAASEAAAELVLRAIGEALAGGRSPCIVLSGGRTPRDTLALLARGITGAKLPVQRLLWLFGDERWVPRTHPRSNEGMAREALLTPIGAPGQTVASWNPTEGEPVDAAARYGQWTARVRASGGCPDVALLGLGADGHTASLFPGAEARLPAGGSAPVGPDLPADAAAVYLASEREWRLTLCPGFLSSARLAVFLAFGAEKRAALRRVLDGDPALPGSWIRAAATLFIVTEETVGPGLRDYREDARFA